MTSALHAHHPVTACTTVEQLATRWGSDAVSAAPATGEPTLAASALQGLVGLLHPARTPGPGTYKPKNIGLEGNAGTCVQKKHTYAFSFGNTGRFLSHDTNQKSPAPNHYKYSQNCISTGIGW